MLILDVLATMVIIWWVLQGARLTLITWAAPYDAFWAFFQGFLTLLLIIPLFAIWH